MNKAYNRINWENYPSDATPINEQNLNRIDGATDELDNRVISLDTRKFDKSEAQGLIKNITFDLQTGILTKYYYNGSTEEINTGISKLNMNLRFDKESQILYIVNADGTEDPIDLSVFITNYEFRDSDTIAHNVSSDGTVTSIVKDGSITEDKLQSNYLAEIKVEAAKAEAAATAAEASKTAAAASASTASTKASEASASAQSAAESATTATEKAAEASDSADDAAESATTATQKATESVNSAESALESATSASNSKNAAATSAANAETSATTASTKATEAADSAAAALSSKNAAKASEYNTKESEENAEASKTAAAASASTASTKASEASASAQSAAESATTATEKATEAEASATSASSSAATATTKAEEASSYADSADTYAKQSQSYAVGTGGVRPNEATDNAKYYYEQSKSISEGLSGVLQPMGTVAFANLPTLANAASGWMYNISDQFTTTADFKEGAGNVIPAGANIYKTADGFWDVLAGTPVTTVNGQTGNVSITPANIDAVSKAGDTLDVGAQLKRAGYSSSWVLGREYAMIRQTSQLEQEYVPILSAKTIQGSWELGPYLGNNMHLTFISDADYNSGTNQQTANIVFDSLGGITAPVFNGKATAIKDSGDGRTLTLNYSAAAITNPTYLAAWNGGELRGVSRTALTVGNSDKVDGYHISKITQAQYDSLSTKDPDTLYVIVG